VTRQKILYQGAEAKIILTEYLGKKVVEKRRLKKSYRIKEIDEKLISYRTKEEAKLITQSRECGVSVPIIYDLDVVKGIITMEYLEGPRVKDIFDDIDDEKRKKLCENIGEKIGRLHKNNIIHGDITTSNMILIDDRIYFIDFGLGEKKDETELKGVDLHVLMEAIESTHSKYSSYFNYVLEGYKKSMKKEAITVIRKIDEIIKRGRYR